MALSNSLAPAPAPLPPAAAKRPTITGARQLWSEYVAREAAYDPSLTDLFADDAVVRARATQSGQTREIRMSGNSFKNSLRQSLAQSREYGGRTRYSDPTFTAEGTNVRIGATQTAERTGQRNRLTVLVGPDAVGEWRIRAAVVDVSP